ncbi:MAG: acetyltransferase [Ruminococcaceae bacterium]|nr:acetyltransferase [Oscillospiraceae bacterium]
MKNVIIIGTGGHAKVVADIVKLSNDNLIGFLTSDKTITSFLGKPVLGLDTEYKKFKDAHFIIAVGDSDARKRISGLMADVKWYTAIHPKSIVSKTDTIIGEGTVISANAVVNSCSKIGNHCIINTNCSVEHDNMIKSFSHISVGAMLGGNVTVGMGTWVGIGATVKNGITICDNCLIGAGAVVVKDIETPGIYVGIPAKYTNKYI